MSTTKKQIKRWHQYPMKLLSNSVIESVQLFNAHQQKKGNMLTMCSITELHIFFIFGYKKCELRLIFLFLKEFVTPFLVHCTSALSYVSLNVFGSAYCRVLVCLVLHGWDICYELEITVKWRAVAEIYCIFTWKLPTSRLWMSLSCRIFRGL